MFYRYTLFVACFLLACPVYSRPFCADILSILMETVRQGVLGRSDVDPAVRLSVTDESENFASFGDALLDLLVLTPKLRDYDAVRERFGLAQGQLRDLELYYTLRYFGEPEALSIPMPEAVRRIQTLSRRYWIAESNTPVKRRYPFYLYSVTRLSVPEMAALFGISEPQVYRELGQLGISVGREFGRPLGKSRYDGAVEELKALSRDNLNDLVTTGGALIDAANSLLNAGLTVNQVARVLGVGTGALDFYFHYEREKNRGVSWDRVHGGQKEQEILESLWESKKYTTQQLADELNRRFNRGPSDLEYRSAASVSAKLQHLGLTNPMVGNPDFPSEVVDPRGGYLKLDGKLVKDNAVRFIGENYTETNEWLALELGVPLKTLQSFLSRHHIPSERVRLQKPIVSVSTDKRQRLTSGYKKQETALDGLQFYFKSASRKLPAQSNEESRKSEASLSSRLVRYGLTREFRNAVMAATGYSEEQKLEFLREVERDLESPQTSAARDVLEFYFKNAQNPTLPVGSKEESRKSETVLTARLRRYGLTGEFRNAVMAATGYSEEQKFEFLREVERDLESPQTSAARDVLSFYFKNAEDPTLPVRSTEESRKSEAALKLRLVRYGLTGEFRNAVMAATGYSEEQKLEFLREVERDLESPQTSAARDVLEFYFKNAEGPTLPAQSKEESRKSETVLTARLRRYGLTGEFRNAVMAATGYSEEQKLEFLREVERDLESPPTAAARGILEFYFKNAQNPTLPVRSKEESRKSETALKNWLARYGLTKAFRNAVMAATGYSEEQKLEFLREVERDLESPQTSAARGVLEFYFKNAQNPTLPVRSKEESRKSEDALKYRLTNYGLTREFRNAVMAATGYSEEQKLEFLQEVERDLESPPTAAARDVLSFYFENPEDPTLPVYSRDQSRKLETVLTARLRRYGLTGGFRNAVMAATGYSEEQKLDFLREVERALVSPQTAVARDVLAFYFKNSENPTLPVRSTEESRKPETSLKIRLKIYGLTPEFKNAVMASSYTSDQKRGFLGAVEKVFE